MLDFFCILPDLIVTLFVISKVLINCYFCAYFYRWVSILQKKAESELQKVTDRIQQTQEQLEAVTLKYEQKKEQEEDLSAA